MFPSAAERSLNPFNYSDVECLACPLNVRCDSVSARISAAEGYWISPLRDGSIAIFDCDPERCVSEGHCASSRKEASVNPLCGECDDGYTLWSGTCIKCEAQYGTIFAVLLFLFVLVGLLHLMSQSTSGELKVLTFFTQNALLFTSPLMRSPTIKFLEIFNFRMLDFTGNTCMFPVSDEVWLYADLVVGLLCVLILGCLTMTSFAIHRNAAWIQKTFPLKLQKLLLQLPAAPTQPVQFSFRPFIRTLLGLYIVMYTSIVTTLFELYNCVEVNMGDVTHNLVRTIPSISCDGDTHKTLVPLYAVLIFFFCVAVPGMLLRVLLTARNNGQLLDEDHFLRAYGILTSAYASNLYFYEFVSLFRKTVLIALSVALYGSEEKRLASFSLALIIFLSLHLQWKPFRVKSEDVAEFISLVVLIAIPMLLLSVDRPLSPGTVTTFVAIIVTCTVGLLVWVAWRRRHVIQRLKTLKSESSSDLQASRRRVHSSSRSSVMIGRVPSEPDSLRDRSRTIENLPAVEETESPSDPAHIEMRELPSVSNNETQFHDNAVVDGEGQRNGESPSESPASKSPHAEASPNIAAPPPSPWVEYISDDGFPYYHNPETGETKWQS